MAIKQIQSPKNEKRPLGRIQETKKQTQEYFDLHSCVELLYSIIFKKQPCPLSADSRL